MASEVIAGPVLAASAILTQIKPGLNSGNFGEGDRRNREIIGAEPQGWYRDESRGPTGSEHREGRSDGEGKRKAAKVPGQTAGDWRGGGRDRDRARVRANQEETRDSRVEESRIAPLEVEPERQDREDDCDAQVEPEVDQNPDINCHRPSPHPSPSDWSATAGLRVSARESRSTKKTRGAKAGGRPAMPQGRRRSTPIMRMNGIATL